MNSSRIVFGPGFLFLQHLYNLDSIFGDSTYTVTHQVVECRGCTATEHDSAFGVFSVAHSAKLSVPEVPFTRTPRPGSGATAAGASKLGAVAGAPDEDGRADAKVRPWLPETTFVDDGLQSSSMPLQTRKG